ncbi:MFS transporter [Streptomyces xinghaiensis]|uniref:MFS transporter n=1 Tax=Streptomyces xinghaiensis TaxID=1038928 RepID=UPI000BAFD54D|nr:MFS transporter [Streptomyces xinghaiensis]
MPLARPARRPARSARPPWAGRNYTLLTAAAVVTGLGSSGALIAAAFAVLETGGSGTDVGLVAAARTVPLVLFLLVGGAVADRLPRHRVMVTANTLNCLSQGAFGVLVLTGEPGLWQMMLLSALGGTGHAFFAPAAEGMLLSSVSGEQAGRAFAFFRMGVNGANIGGAALGGALVASVGPGWVLVLDGAAFAVAAALRAFLDLRGMSERTPGRGLLSDLREGWREVSGRPWLWSVVLQFAVVNAVIAAAEAVYGPLVAEEHLGGARPWGLALAALGAGTVLGALLMTRWKPRRLLVTGALSVFVLALPSAALAIPVSAPVLSGVMFATGISIEIFGVTWMMALHQEIPEEKLSRVSSYDMFGSLAMVPVAVALAGPVAGMFGRSAALWGCSALIVLLTAAVLTVPDVRRLTRREHGGPEPVGVLAGPAAGPVPAVPAPAPRVGTENPGKNGGRRPG